jgi:hypothetical protein
VLMAVREGKLSDGKKKPQTLSLIFANADEFETFVERVHAGARVPIDPGVSFANESRTRWVVLAALATAALSGLLPLTGLPPPRRARAPLMGVLMSCIEMI